MRLAAKDDEMIEPDEHERRLMEQEFKRARFEGKVLFIATVAIVVLTVALFFFGSWQLKIS